MWITRKALAEEKKAERELMLELVREVTSTVKAQTAALEKQAAAYERHLSMFDVTDAPEGHTIRDEDEFNMEVERAKAAAVSMKIFGES